MLLDATWGSWGYKRILRFFMIPGLPGRRQVVSLENPGNKLFILSQFQLFIPLLFHQSLFSLLLQVHEFVLLSCVFFGSCGHFYTNLKVFHLFYLLPDTGGFNLILDLVFDFSHVCKHARPLLARGWCLMNW